MKKQILYLAGVINETMYYERTGVSIPVKDKVRNEVATIPTYWPKPGLALTHIQKILGKYGYGIPMPSFTSEDKMKSHTEKFSIVKYKSPDKPDDFVYVDNDLIFQWYWVSEDKCEITTYIS